MHGRLSLFSRSNLKLTTTTKKPSWIIGVFPTTNNFPCIDTSGENGKTKCSLWYCEWDFSPDRKKVWTIFLPLIFSGIPWWSNDWLACGIGSKVFSQHSVLREMPFSVNKSKTFQPLETIIIPWDNSSSVYKEVSLCGVLFFCFFQPCSKRHFSTGQNKVGLILGTHPHNGETQMALKKMDCTVGETTQAKHVLCSSGG